MVARFGGDEFAILLNDLECNSERGIQIVCERLVETIARTPMNVNGMPLHLGLSIGVSICPRVSQEIRELIEAADQAMYDAKRNKEFHCKFSGDSFLVPRNREV